MPIRRMTAASSCTALCGPGARSCGSAVAAERARLVIGRRMDADAAPMVGGWHPDRVSAPAGGIGRRRLGSAVAVFSVAQGGNICSPRPVTRSSFLPTGPAMASRCSARARAEPLAVSARAARAPRQRPRDRCASSPLTPVPRPLRAALLTRSALDQLRGRECPRRRCLDHRRHSRGRRRVARRDRRSALRRQAALVA